MPDHGRGRRSAPRRARRKPGRPRNTNSADTKLGILEAAVDCFADGGFDGTTSITIADRAGVTPTTVYHHFANKRALYVAAYEYSLELAWRSFKTAVERTQGSVVDHVMAVLRAAADIIETRPALTLLALRAQTDVARTEVHLDVVDETFTIIEERGLEHGELHPADAVRLRATIEMLLWGLSVNMWTERRRREECLGALEQLLRSTLLSPRAKPAARRSTP